MASKSIDARLCCLSKRIDDLAAAETQEEFDSGVSSIVEHGAVGDARTLTFGSVSVGSNVLNVTNGDFTRADIGKTVGMPSGMTGSNPAYYGVITAVISPTQVETTTEATAATSNQEVLVGTDNTAAIAAAVTAAGPGGSVFYPKGQYLTTAVTKVLEGQTHFGVGASSVFLWRIGSISTGVARNITDSVVMLIAGTAPADDYTTYFNERGDQYASDPLPLAQGTAIRHREIAAGFAPITLGFQYCFSVASATALAQISRGMDIQLAEGCWQPMPIRCQWLTVEGTSTVTAASTCILGGVSLTVAALTHRLRAKDAITFTSGATFVLSAAAEAGATTLTGLLGGIAAGAGTNTHIVPGDVAYVVHTFEPLTIAAGNYALTLGQMSRSPTLTNTGRYGNHIWHLTPSAGLNVPTGGSYTLTFAAANPAAGTTAAIAAGATPAAVQAAIEGVVGVGNVLVEGGPLTNAAPLRIEMRGTWAKTLFKVFPTVTPSLSGTSPTLTVADFQNGQAPLPPDPNADFWDGTHVGFRNANLWPVSGYWIVDAIKGVTIRGITLAKLAVEPAPYGLFATRARNIRMRDIAHRMCVPQYVNCEELDDDANHIDCSVAAIKASVSSITPKFYAGNGCQNLSLRNFRMENAALWIEEGAQTIHISGGIIRGIRDDTATALNVTGLADDVHISDMLIQAGGGTALAIANVWRATVTDDVVCHSDATAFQGIGPGATVANFSTVPTELSNGRLRLTVGGIYEIGTSGSICFRVQGNVDAKLNDPEIVTGQESFSTLSRIRGGIRRRFFGTSEFDFVNPSNITLVAGSALDPRHSSKLQVRPSAAANLTLTSTPTIVAANNLDGTPQTIINVSPTFNITLQSESSLPGSGLKLGAATRTLAPGGSITLRWSVAANLWVETPLFT